MSRFGGGLVHDHLASVERTLTAHVWAAAGVVALVCWLTRRR